MGIAYDYDRQILALVVGHEGSVVLQGVPRPVQTDQRWNHHDRHQVSLHEHL